MKVQAKPPYNEIVHVRLTKDQYKWLKKIATGCKATIAETLRTLLNQEMKKK